MKATQPQHLAQTDTNTAIRPLLLWLSLVFWLSSLALPALITSRSEPAYGYGILFLGWLGFAGIKDGLDLLGVLAWWANPFYLWAISKAFAGKQPRTSVFLAMVLAPLTFLLSNFAINAVPSFATVTGYGPGALLWFLAILSLAYATTKDTELSDISKATVGIACVLITAFIGQASWRAVASNDSEKNRLPYYSAKRGLICSATATPLPINQKQSAIVLKTDTDYWLDALLNWGIPVVQVYHVEFRKVSEPPFKASSPISSPAQYGLYVEGDPPFFNPKVQNVTLKILDLQNNEELGHMTFKRQLSGGFCPSLPFYTRDEEEEVLKWLAPFIQEKTR